MQPPVDPASVGARRGRRGTTAAGASRRWSPRPTSPGGSVAPSGPTIRSSTPGSGSADGPEVPPAVTHRHGGDGAELGHPVAAQDLRRRQPGAEPTQGRRGDRRAADVDDGQAREVRRLEAGASRR